jgi:GT2 family glycosyltransferase
MSVPTVGVVVVNYNGGDLTIDCLRSVVRTTWPAGQLRVVLVDNASGDGVVERVRSELPVVRIVERATNDGFGAACNAGIADLGDVDAVALVNNDARVEPSWLAPLVRALEAEPRVGAACPKILLADRYVEILLHSSTARDVGDGRERGVMVSGARVDGGDVWGRSRLRSGFLGREAHEPVAGSQWSGADSSLLVPATGGRLELSMASTQNPATVTLSVSGALTTVDVGPSRRWYVIATAGTPHDIINNAGTQIDESGFGSDRGYLERDDGRYDRPVDVQAWCGGAVLLRASYLADVGGFDERLFLYYEDVDLSLRGTERGWRYRYVPESVVRHVHGASSGTGSSFKQWYDDRNRLLVLARHGTTTATTRATLRYLLTTASYARRDVVRPLVAHRAPHPEIVRMRLSAFGSFVRLLPGTLRARRAVSRA